MSYWKRFPRTGTWRYEIPNVAFLGFIQHHGKKWQVTIYSLGAIKATLVFPRLREAKTFVENWIELTLRSVLATLRRKEKED